METNNQTKENRMTNETLDLGNNESLTRGVFENTDGTFTALTFSQSKEFKTRKGAEKWFAGRCA